MPTLEDIPDAIPVYNLSATPCMWINDMFACAEDTDCTLTPGLYGVPGSTITIPTPAGPAIGLVQPTPGPVDTVARQLTAVFIGLLSHINFATDVPATQETGLLV